jgi:hypothetical protein
MIQLNKLLPYHKWDASALLSALTLRLTRILKLLESSSTVTVRTNSSSRQHKDSRAIGRPGNHPASEEVYNSSQYPLGAFKSPLLLNGIYRPAAVGRKEKEPSTWVEIICGPFTLLSISSYFLMVLFHVQYV